VAENEGISLFLPCTSAKSLVALFFGPDYSPPECKNRRTHLLYRPYGALTPKDSMLRTAVAAKIMNDGPTLRICIAHGSALWVLNKRPSAKTVRNKASPPGRSWKTGLTHIFESARFGLRSSPALAKLECAGHHPSHCTAVGSCWLLNRDASRCSCIGAAVFQGPSSA
jgi:hypothetical protein